MLPIASIAPLVEQALQTPVLNPALNPALNRANDLTANLGDARVADSANPFAGFLEQAAGQVTRLRSEANEKVRGLMTGDGTDVHTALIATQKADLAFQLALSVRNKAIGAYQQLMGMQF